MSTRSQLYGSGVFTTVRIIDRKPWLWEKHWRRLEHDAAVVGMDIGPLRSDSLLRSIDESIPEEHGGIRKLRITIEDRRAAPLWTEHETESPSVWLTFLEREIDQPPAPFRIGVAPHRVNSTSPIAGLKTGNYLEQTMSLDEAMTRGLHETVRLNERGHVTSACMANIFWSKGGRIFTPALSTGCLPGTTREFIIESLSVTESEAGLEELINAEGIFLTSAGLGVLGVNVFEGRELQTTDHPILSLVPGGD